MHDPAEMGPNQVYDEDAVLNYAVNPDNDDGPVDGLNYEYYDGADKAVQLDGEGFVENGPDEMYYGTNEQIQNAEEGFMHGGDGHGNYEQQNGRFTFLQELMQDVHVITNLD